MYSPRPCSSSRTNVNETEKSKQWLASALQTDEWPLSAVAWKKHGPRWKATDIMPAIMSEMNSSNEMSSGSYAFSRALVIVHSHIIDRKMKKNRAVPE